MSHWVDWIGLALILIGWILLLIAVIYVAGDNHVNGTFWALSITGLVLMLIGVLMVVWGHWSILFGKSKMSSDDVVSQVINAPDDVVRSVMNAPDTVASPSYGRSPPSGFVYVQPNARV